jgi:hypothetical protein
LVSRDEVNFSGSSWPLGAGVKILCSPLGSFKSAFTLTPRRQSSPIRAKVYSQGQTLCLKLASGKLETTLLKKQSAYKR